MFVRGKLSRFSLIFNEITTGALILMFDLFLAPGAPLFVYNLKILARGIQYLLLLALASEYFGPPQRLQFDTHCEPLGVCARMPWIVNICPRSSLLVGSQLSVNHRHWKKFK